MLEKACVRTGDYRLLIAFHIFSPLGGKLPVEAKQKIFQMISQKELLFFVVEKPLRSRKQGWILRKKIFKIIIVQQHDLCLRFCWDFAQ